MDPAPSNQVEIGGRPATAVSDQARAELGGPPADIGAHGTTDTPPRSAAVYRTAEQERQAPPSIAASAPAPSNPMAAAPMTAPMPGPADSGVATVPPAPAVAQAAPSAPSVPATPVETPAQRMDRIEGAVASLHGLIEVVVTKLNEISAPKPVAISNNGVPSNTGQLSAAPAGAPLAPTAPVAPSADGAPIPTPSAPVDPTPPYQQKVATIGPDEADLTVAQYIEKHFRNRDLTIDQIAEVLRMDAAEVVDILKQLGYQFPDGV